MKKIFFVAMMVLLHLATWAQCPSAFISQQCVGDGDSMRLVVTNDTSFVGYLWSNGATSAAITVARPLVNNSTTYTVRANCPNGFFTNTSVLVKKKPARWGTSVCSGSSVTAPNGYTQYIWSDGLVENWGPSPQSTTGHDTMTVFCYPNNWSGGCVDTMSFVVKPVPTLTMVRETGPFCPNQMFNVTGVWQASTIGTFQLDYSSTPGCGPRMQMPLPDSSGSWAKCIAYHDQQIIGLFTANNGCSVRDTVLAGALPMVWPTKTETLTCGELTVSLTNPQYRNWRNQMIFTPVTYLWSDGNADSLRVFPRLLNYQSYTVTVTTIESACTHTILIGVRARLNTTITASNICQTSQTLVTNTGDIWSGDLRYRWNTNATTIDIYANTAGTYTVTTTEPASGCTMSASISLYNPPTATASKSSDLSCIIPSVSLTATGGGTYAWSNGDSTAVIDVGIAGTYTVTVTGAGGCTATKWVTVYRSSALPTSTLAKSNNLTCRDTSAVLTATGGGSYTWSNSDTTATTTATATGTYTVTISWIGGCSTSRSVSVTSNTTAPTLTTTVPFSLTCTRTSTTLTASSNGTYTWSDGATTSITTATTAGIYTVTATNSVNGCTASASVTVIVDTVKPVVYITGDTVSTCKISQYITANGGVSYLWDNGHQYHTRQINMGGTYTVTVTNTNGCITTKSINVMEDRTPPTITIIQIGDTLIASGAVSYVWNNGIVNIGYSDRYIPTASGIYKVYGTGSNNCSALVSYSYTFVGTENATTTAPNIYIYPNPTTDVIHIEGWTGEEVEIFNLLGQRIATYKNGNETIDLSSYPPGVYLLKIGIICRVFKKIR